MRILHTSDWHLGKTLEGYSRLEEQEKFIEELIAIVENKNIDLMIIAGDIYDTSNPSATAEKLFYKSAKRLSHNGKIPILVIAGNHDNPERLTAVTPLAYEQSIIMMGTPKSIAKTGNYQNYSIVKSGEGYIELALNGETAVILTIPYPSEKRLNEFIDDELESEDRSQKTYSKKIGQIFSQLSKNYRDDTINIATGHFFILGGESSDSERPIQLGGGLAVSPTVLPEKAQYIALGHLHRPQKVGGTATEAYYSGSPIQYSKSEINYNKSVYIADIKANTSIDLEKVVLTNYKPIEIWECCNIDEAIAKCEADKDREVWVYLNIHTDRTLLSSEIKTIKSLKKDIVEIHMILEEIEQPEDCEEQLDDRPMSELFREFYIKKQKVEPSQELLDLLMHISLRKGEDNETETS